MKAFTIAWKDTLIRMRDRNALILVLIAPLLISAIMGAALSGPAKPRGGSGRNNLLMIVNDDTGSAGKELVDALTKESSVGSWQIIQFKTFDSARRAVASDTAQAAIYVPQNFSNSLAAVKSDQGSSPPTLSLFTASSVENASSEALKGLVSRLNTALISRRITSQLLLELNPGFDARSRIQPVLDEELPVRFTEGNSDEITIQNVTENQGAVTTNPFAFFAPSLAVFFLMFSMFEAPRSILLEQEEGTLGRLLRAPISVTQILLGKLGGSYLTGIVQFTLLVIASRLIFNLRWGSSLVGLALMVLAVVMASASMGAVVAAFSKDVLQAGALGGAITLLSAGLGGNFFAADRMPGWLQVFSRLTINRWALEGFSNLTVRGLGLRDVLLDAMVLFGIAGTLFILAFARFRRRIVG